MTYKPFHLYVKNTLIIVLLNEIAILWSASFCAYGFARIQFPGRDFWFGVVMATMMVPYFALMVPIFVIFSRLQWIDTFLPLTVPLFFGGGAFNIFHLPASRPLPGPLAISSGAHLCSDRRRRGQSQGRSYRR